MQGDDPPYLSVGTAVSAKYKGAFCEAKVSKVVRIVKCKVTYKSGLGSATVSDEQIKGTLRVGKVVQAKHADRKEFVDATIAKIQDCSQYTVVFDDGDITTLRRTALCLKSGRHFNESETLDQLPLTHPEHFLNPVVGSRRGRRSRQLKEDSSDGELEEEKEPKLLQEVYSSDIGRVVSVEASDNKKKNKDNWFPGLVVIPSAQPTVRINVKDEFLVRSFKDGRYYTVPKKEVTDFSREQGARVESSALAEAVEKTLRYLDGDELPAHWERNALFYSPPKAEKHHHHQDQREKLQRQQQQQEKQQEKHLQQMQQQRQQSPSGFSGGDASSRRGDRASSSRAGSRSEDSDDNFSDSSDDEPREEKDHFVATLYKFLDDADTPMNRFPVIGNRDVDLYRLFRLVEQIGGYNRVTNQGKWRAVATRLKFSGTQNVCNQVKQVYKKFLLSYEGFYRTLGCTMRTHPRNNRFQRGGSRTLIRDRDRIATPVPSPKPASTSQDNAAPTSTTTSNTNTTESESITTEDETFATATPATTPSTVVTASPSSSKSKATSIATAASNSSTATTTTTVPAVTEKSRERSITPAAGLNGSTSSRRVYPSSRKMAVVASNTTAAVVSAVADKKTEEDNVSVSTVRRKGKVLEVSDSSDEEEPQQPATSREGKGTAVVATTESTPKLTTSQNKPIPSTSTVTSTPNTNTTTTKEASGRPKRIIDTNAIKPKDRRATTPSSKNATTITAASATTTGKGTEPVAACDKSPIAKGGKAAAGIIDGSTSRGRSDGSSDRDVGSSTKLQRSTSTTSSGSGSGGNSSQTRSKSQQPVSTKAVEKPMGKAVVAKAPITPRNIKTTVEEDKTKDNDKDKKRGRKRLSTTDEKEKSTNESSSISTVTTVEKSGNTGDGWTGQVSVGDKLRVFYGPTHESKVTYEAKVLEIDKEGSSNNSGGSTGYHGPLYLVHYTGWNNRYDEYIQPHRIAENLSVTAKAKRLKNAAAAAGGAGGATGNAGGHHHKSYSVAKSTSSATAAAGKRGRGMSITGRSTLPDSNSESGGNMASAPARCTTPSSVTSTNSSNSRTKSPAGTTSTLSTSTSTTPRYIPTTIPTTPTSSSAPLTVSSRPTRQPPTSTTTSDKDSTSSAPSVSTTPSGTVAISRRSRRTSVPATSSTSLQTADTISDKSDSDEREQVVDAEVEEEDEDDQPVKKKKNVIGAVNTDVVAEEDKKGRTRSGAAATTKTPTAPDASKVGGIGIRRRLIKTRAEKQRKDDDDTEKEEEPIEKPKRSRKLRKLIDIKPTIAQDSDDEANDEEDEEPDVRPTTVATPKGRDFDLNQIRSELKGLSSTTTKSIPVVNVDKKTEKVKDEPAITSEESCSADKVEEKPTIKEADKKEDKSSSSEDIYEFKEPEPFDFELKIMDDKSKKRFAGRVFDEVLDKSPPKKKTKPIIEEKKTPFQQRFMKTQVKKEEPIEIPVEKEKTLTLFDKLVESPSFNTKPTEKLPEVNKDLTSRKLSIDVDSVQLFPDINEDLSENDDSQSNSIFTKKEQQFLDGKFDGKLTDDMKTDDEDEFDKKHETDEDENFRNTIKQCIMREDSNDLIEGFSLSKEDAKVYSFTVESEDGISEVKTEIDEKKKEIETKDFSSSIKDCKLSERLFSKSDMEMSKIDSDNRSDSMDIDQDCTASPIKVFETKPTYANKPSISSEMTSLFSDILHKSDKPDKSELMSLKSEIKPLMLSSLSSSKTHILVETNKLSKVMIMGEVKETKDLKAEVKKDIPVATSGGGKRGKKVLSQEFIDDTDSDSDSGERLVIARSDEELSQTSDDITPIISSLNKPDSELSTDILAVGGESSAETDQPLAKPSSNQPILPAPVTLGNLMSTSSLTKPAVTTQLPTPVKRNFNIEEITKGALASTLISPITSGVLSSGSSCIVESTIKLSVTSSNLTKMPEGENCINSILVTDKENEEEQEEKIEEDEKDEPNALLLCEETIPGSPAPASEPPVSITSPSLGLPLTAATLSTPSKTPCLNTNTPLLTSNTGNATLEMPFASAPSGSSTNNTTNLSNLANIASSNITSTTNPAIPSVTSKGLFGSGASILTTGVVVRDDKDKHQERLLLHHHQQQQQQQHRGPELIGLAARMQQQHAVDALEDRGDREAASILVDNTPPTTPESTISNLSPRGENGDISPGHHLSSPHSSPPLHPPSNLPPTSKRRTSSGGSTSSCTSITTAVSMSAQGQSPMGVKLGAGHILGQGLYHQLQQHIEDMVVDGNERGGLNSGINLLASTSSSVARANVLPPSPCKKRRRSNKSDHTPDRTPPTFATGPPSTGLKRGRKPLRRPSPKVIPSAGLVSMHHHHGTGNSDTEDGDDDDTTDSVHSGASAVGGGLGAMGGGAGMDRYSRSPRPAGKYNFVVEFDPSLDSGQRIAVLQQKLQDLRKAYASVKSELVTIERRRKKIRRKEREALKAAKQEMACT